MNRMITSIAILLLLFACPIFGQKLKGGDSIAKFSFTAITGKSYSDQDFQSKKVVLAFFRFVGCPITNYRIQELKEEYPQLVSDDFEVIVVFESPTENVKEYAAAAKLPFVIVADPALKLYKKFGVEKSLGKSLKTIFKDSAKEYRNLGKNLYTDIKYKKEGARTRIPAEFILQEGKLLEAHYENHIGDHLPLYRINQF